MAYRKMCTIAFKDENGDQQQSKLDFVAAHPKPIECQNVKTCLHVFCDETATALQTHPGIDFMDTVGTVKFIKMFVQF